jgi:oligopeptide/dipeptide ABC transporter ATP-binding protein
MTKGNILSALSLSKWFFVKRKRNLFSLVSDHIVIKAVNEIDIGVEEGENYALVGESGSGKTTLGYILARVLEPTSGEIHFSGRDITHIKGTALKELRGNMQMVLQDPGTSLNPRQTVESILSLPLKLHSFLGRKEIKKRIAELLEAVYLPVEVMRWYPGALSGGQKQRVNLARVLALNPKLLILDEPTSALDVSVQAKILQLLVELKEQLKLTYIFITHDLSVVRNISDRIAVMYLGRIIEQGPTPAIFEQPVHPYTRALLSAIPTITTEEKKLLPKEVTLEGEIPSPANIPENCPFFSRCQEKQKKCETSVCPDLKEIEKGHFVRCLL